MACHCDSHLCFHSLYDAVTIYNPSRFTIVIPANFLVFLLKGSYNFFEANEVSITSGRALAIEELGRAVLPGAYGSDNYLDSIFTVKALKYIANRFGPAASFTGTYWATSWELNINRTSADSGRSGVYSLPTHH